MSETTSFNQSLSTVKGEAISGFPPDASSLLELRRHLSIAHHLPGRIRLRVSPAIYGCAPGFDAGKSRALLGKLWGIRDVRVNMAAASVLIEYDPKLISLEEWETLVRGDAAAAGAVLRHWLDRACQPDQQLQRGTR